MHCIAPLFSAMVMDTHDEAMAAWKAITSQPQFPSDDGLVQINAITEARLRHMLELFDAMPTIDGPDGRSLSLASEESLVEIRNGWLKGQWANAKLWNAQASPPDVMRRRFAEFFRENYLRIVELSRQ